MSTDTDLLMSIASDIGELKEGVRGIRAEQARAIEQTEILTARVSALENARSYFRGAQAILSAAAGAAMALLIGYVKSWFNG